MRTFANCWGLDPFEIRSFLVSGSGKRVILVYDDDRGIEVTAFAGNEEPTDLDHLLAHVVLDPAGDDQHLQWQAEASCTSLSPSLEVYIRSSGVNGQRSETYRRTNETATEQHAFLVKVGDFVKFLDLDRSRAAFRVDFGTTSVEDRRNGTVAAVAPIERWDYPLLCELLSRLSVKLCMDVMPLVCKKVLETMTTGHVPWQIINLLQNKNVLAWADKLQLCQWVQRSATSLLINIPTYVEAGLPGAMAARTLDDVGQILNLPWRQLRNLTMHFSYHTSVPRYETHLSTELVVPGSTEELWLEADNFSCLYWLNMLDLSGTERLRVLDCRTRGDWPDDAPLKNVLEHVVHPLECIFLHQDAYDVPSPEPAWDLIPEKHRGSVRELVAFGGGGGLLGSDDEQDVVFPVLEKLGIVCHYRLPYIRGDVFAKFPAVRVLNFPEPGKISPSLRQNLGQLEVLSTWYRQFPKSSCAFRSFEDRIPSLRWLYLEVHPISMNPLRPPTCDSTTLARSLAKVMPRLVGLRLTGAGCYPRLALGELVQHWNGPHLEFLAFLVPPPIELPSELVIRAVIHQFNGLRHLSFVGSLCFTTPPSLVSFITSDPVVNLTFFGILAVTPADYRTATPERIRAIQRWLTDEMDIIAPLCSPAGWTCEAIGPAVVMWPNGSPKPDELAYLGPEVFLRDRQQKFEGVV